MNERKINERKKRMKDEEENKKLEEEVYLEGKTMEKDYIFHG